MKLNKPKNSNYAAVVVDISVLVPLENCDNVQAAIIMGNQVIVSKEVKIGDVGIFFPLECQLMHTYMYENNLYNHSEKNKDVEKKGYFSDNGRVRCQKFRGHKSEGLFMPIESIAEFLEKGDVISIGDEFDELNGEQICRKYVVRQMQGKRDSSSKVNKSQKKESKLVDNQFRFHEDTSMLYKNLHRINPEDYIHISYKMHGTSGISANILCKKKLNIVEKLLSKLGINIITEKYDNIYASRKVIKNPDLNPNAQHYYGADIWGIANNIVFPLLPKGMTAYYEIVGYLPNGGMIQKGYDYGFDMPAANTPYMYGVHFGVFIYRLTNTNPDGKVLELSGKQVQEWCKANDLKAVPELYYGKASDFYDRKILGRKRSVDHLDLWRNTFLEQVKLKYNEKDCYMCNNKVPEEGCVLRIEKLNIEAYKAKSNAFYELETKMLDKGEVDIEEEN